jgi:Domain of unknown function (DUF4328)
VVIIALVATMLSDVVAAVFEVMHYGILADLDRGVDLSYEKVQGSDDRLLTAGGAQGLSFLAAGIAFLAWFHRVYRNLPRLGTWPLRYDFGWAVGAWLIPVFNLWRPKQLVNDAWRGSEPTPGPKRLEANPHVPRIVHAWWVGWVLASVLSGLGITVGTEAQTLPEQKAATILEIVTAIATFAGALLAIPVVRSLTNRQTEAIERALAAAPPPPPPPPGYRPG